MYESFWDAHGVEIGARAIFDIFPDPEDVPVPDFSELDAVYFRTGIITTALGETT